MLSRLLICLSLASIVVGFESACFAAGAAPIPPAIRALLIGVDEYKSSEISQLHGAVNDVLLMREILIGKFGAPPTNIAVLKNEQATRNAIIEKVKSHLIARANKDDVVIVHFSGHGSQIKDVSGDEVDRLDETLVPYDSRTQGIFDISDDEIYGLLTQLTQKTRHVTLIFDSCHSGAATKGNTVRAIEADRRDPPPSTDFAMSLRGGEGLTDFRPNDSDYVLIAGSLAKETSSETLFEGTSHGVLTWFLASALKAAPERTTYRDVIDQVKREVRDHFFSQQPQIEGPGQDLVVFGVDKINVKPYVLVEPRGVKRARVEAGKVLGLGKGSTLKAYPPRTTDFQNTKSVATLKVTNVMDFEAEAEIVKGGPVLSLSRALLEATSFGDTSIPIFVEPKEQASPLSKVKEMLAEMQAITFVKDETGARLLITERDGKLLVHSGDLQLLVPPVAAQNPDAAQLLADNVKNLVHWLVLLDLKNPTSKIALGLEIRRVSDGPDAPAPQELVACPVGWEEKGPQPPLWCTLEYRIQNNHVQPLYIYVLDIVSDGSINLLYPKHGEQEALPPGQDLRKLIGMGLPPGHTAVRDTLKVIASVKQIDPSVFPQGPIRAAPTVRAKASWDPLTRFLADVTRGRRHAFVVGAIDVDNWVTIQTSVKTVLAGPKLSSFSLHFDGRKSIADIQSKVSDTRELCSNNEKAATEDCEQLRPFTKDGTILELLPRSTTRGVAETISVGEAFDEAYRLQGQTGAKRVEPLLETQMPGVVTEQGIDKRDVTGDDKHDPAAAADDQWNLKQIRATEGWKKIRERFGVREGAEADGILIAHPDTGFRHHPETWTEYESKRPIDAANGRNYYEGSADALDPLLDDRLLDNPGHGTASGSVIVSPAGCQLSNAPGCVNGIARGAQLIPLRVHRSVSQFNTRNLSQAIQDVADRNLGGDPRLISIAMGGPPTLTMWRAVRAAEQNGILIVAAAGNYVRTVVWPARFRSTIAVAACNVHCLPWKHSSHGSAVDIMAPGESVWRATLNENHEYINAMGKGTTFATGNVAGAAGLWLSAHRDDPSLLLLAEQGLLTQAFRTALRASAWRPSSSPGFNPPGTQCDTSTWDTDYGAGLLDVAALLDVPLAAMQPKAVRSIEDEMIPLFASLYQEGTDTEHIRADYLSLFSPARGASLEQVSSFETEILYHCTSDEELQRGIDALVAGQRGVEPSDAIRRALLHQDLSGRLRQALSE